jgi:hypothetical protein
MASTWADTLLAALGAPDTTNNQQKLAAWNACEGNLTGGSGLGINNPFNTTLKYGGGMSVNSAGVKSYPSLAVGLKATLMTIGAPRYAKIVANLRADGPQGDFAAAVGASGWGTSGSCIARTMGAPLAAPAEQTATLTSSNSSSAGGGAESNDLSRMTLITAIATYGPGILDNETVQKKFGGSGSAAGFLKSVPVIGSLFTAGSDAINGTEVIAGTIAWLMKPTTLLRGAELLLGAGLIAVGGAMYLQILAPGAGGLIGGIAAAATPVGRAASLGGSAASSVAAGASAAAQRIPDSDDRQAVRAEKNPGPRALPKPVSHPGPGRDRVRPLVSAGGAMSRTHNELGEEYF